MKEVVILKVGTEHINIGLKEKGKERRLTMRVSGNVSKLNKETTDRVEMLSIIKHFTGVGYVVSGDINRMRQIVKGEEPTMSSYEEKLVFDF
jgi:hypothetical protein